MPLNGKVREWIDGNDSEFLDRYKSIRQMYGNHFEFFISNFLFDPKYGVHENIEDFTKEHCGYIEDFAVQITSFFPRQFWKTVGWYDQKYADDSKGSQDVKGLQQKHDDEIQKMKAAYEALQKEL